MNKLNPRERELVSLAAALASNCVPCIEHHVPEARQAGLSDEDIRLVVELADAVRRVPARAVLEAALAQLGEAGTAGTAAAACAGVSAGSACC